MVEAVLYSDYGDGAIAQPVIETALSQLTLGFCAGGSFWEAAILGNLAAIIVVRQFGTATTTPDEGSFASITRNG